jgi:urease accessory protein
MMLIKEKAGNLKSIAVDGRQVDVVSLEWYETAKRILHKKTRSGKEVTMKFLNEAQLLQQDDVIYADNEMLIAIDIIPCEVIVIKTASMFEMAYVCYEIGNKHLPLFYEDEELLIPYEAPVYRMLQAGGFNVAMEKRKLLNQLKSSVSPHPHDANNSSLFSKILQLTTKAADAKQSS